MWQYKWLMLIFYGLVYAKPFDEKLQAETGQKPRIQVDGN